MGKSSTAFDPKAFVEGQRPGPGPKCTTCLHPQAKKAIEDTFEYADQVNKPVNIAGLWRALTDPKKGLAHYSPTYGTVLRHIRICMGRQAL